MFAFQRQENSILVNSKWMITGRHGRAVGCLRNYLSQSWCQLSGLCCSVYKHGFSPADKKKKVISCNIGQHLLWELSEVSARGKEEQLVCKSWHFPDDLQVHHCNYDPEHLCRWVSVWTWAVSSVMLIHLSHPTGCWGRVLCSWFALKFMFQRLQNWPFSF